jgi:YidC/Oxa1 family membrane protein insertase
LQDNRRIIIAALLSILIFSAWDFLVLRPERERAEKARKAGTPAAVTTAPKPEASQLPTVKQPGPAPAPAPPPAGAPGAPEETIVLETAELEATFSSHGGALQKLLLKGKKFRRQREGKDEKDEPVNLVHVGPGEPYALAVAPSPELGGASDLASDPAPRTPMRVVSHDARSVTFEGLVAGVGVRKRFAVSERPYELDGEIAIFGVERPGAVTVLFPSFQAPDAPKPGFFSGGAVTESEIPFCRAGGKTERYGGKESLQRLPGAVSFVGLDQHFFVTALIPSAPEGECLFAKGRTPGASFAGLRLPVDQPRSIAFKLFIGPKQVDLLRGYGRDLDTAVDYGSVTQYFAFFARMLLWVMQKFHALARNWGVAIILLTVLVKVLLYPLTYKSMQSMQEMRKLQPEIEKLKAKLGDDKEKLNLAVMQLYQQHKVNPLGGCLPMLFQMPIWLALYATLQTAVELYNEPFLWIRDLTQMDPIYVLPLTMGASSFIMQKLSPQPADNAQAKMLLYFMPAFFTFIMLKLPAGLTLYILVNNLLSIAQQQWMMRKQKAAEPAKA